MLRTLPSEMMTMYGRKVIRKRITVETDPILAVEKNVDAMKLFAIAIDEIRKNVLII